MSEFTCFLDLPKELRLQIWELHFSAHLGSIHVVHIDDKPEGDGWETFSCISIPRHITNLFPRPDDPDSIIPPTQRAATAAINREAFGRYRAVMKKQQKQTESINIARFFCFAYCDLRGGSYGYRGWKGWMKHYDARTRPVAANFVTDLVYLKLPVDLTGLNCIPLNLVNYLSSKGRKSLWSKLQRIALCTNLASLQEELVAHPDPEPSRHHDVLARLVHLKELWLIVDGQSNIRIRENCRRDRYGFVLVSDVEGFMESEAHIFETTRNMLTRSAQTPNRKLIVHFVVDDMYRLAMGGLYLEKSSSSVQILYSSYRKRFVARQIR